MKISVVTVCFNSEKTIRHAVESFLLQRHPDKEMLVIDGGSRDRTVEIVREYRAPDIHVASEPDKGIYDAMNKGLRTFGGDAVGFLNSDDAFHSESSLERIDDALQGADIVFGDLFMVSDHNTKRLVRSWKAGVFTPSSFRFGWVPPHPTFYVRRAVAAAVGEFDLKYKIASDYDYMLRALMKFDFRSAAIPEYLVDYQMGGASSAGLRNMIRGNLECLDSRRRHLGGWPIDLALFIRPARRLVQIFERRGAGPNDRP